MAVPVSVVYLDVDDEITSAASRIRTATESRVALVLPAGSRLATSRINFRLLAREAENAGRELLIVAPEGATRSLAASAGLLVHATVRELEDAVALAAEVPTPAPTLAPTSDAPRPTMGGSDSLKSPAPGAREGAPGRRIAANDRPERPERGSIAGRSAAADLPVVAGTRGRDGAGLRLGPILIGLLVVAFVAAGIVGSQVLPSATIVVTPRIETVGPLSFDVLADPTAAGPDLGAGIVPATRPEIPLDASGDYPATDKKVEETKATGTVTFSSLDPARSNSIASGSIVATSSDTRFVTGRAVILPPATLISDGHGGFSVEPSTADAPVTATKAGTDSNVAAGAIRIVPSGENAVVTKVTNKLPTSGGTHTETLIVGQNDVDAALADLTAQLDNELDQVVSEPGQILPGLTVFPETKQRTEPLPSIDPTTLVGQQIQTFSLSASATGTVTAVDESAVTALATDRLRSAVTADRDLVAGSIEVTVGDGRVQGPDIVFPVRASARQVRRVVAADLVDAVRGHSRAEARTILEAYGDTTIDLWPGFVTSIPGYDFRIDLSIRGVPAVEGSPSPTDGSATRPPATPRPTLRPTLRPTAQPSPSGSSTPAP